MQVSNPNGAEANLSPEMLDVKVLYTPGSPLFLAYPIPNLHQVSDI